MADLNDEIRKELLDLRLRLAYAEQGTNKEDNIDDLKIKIEAARKRMLQDIKKNVEAKKNGKNR